jgi:hypothetical protein
MCRVFFAVRTSSAVIGIAPKVVGSTVITAPEAITVGFPLLTRKMRMAVFIAVFHVGPAVIGEVLSCAFDSIVKAAALKIVQLSGRRIPVAIVILANSRGGWGGRRGVGPGRDQARCPKQERKCRNCKAIQFHGSISPFILGFEMC